MTRAKLMLIGLGLALVALMAAPAAAQDGPSITVEPMTVEAPGEQEFTVTGSGWTAAPPIFVLPCEAPESGDAADIDTATCDTSNLTPATPDADGNFEVTVTYDVPAEGIAIGAGDAASTEAAGAVITVGAGEAEGEGEGEAEGEGEDGATEGEGEEEGEEEELATTGVESGLLAVIGIAVVAAGALAVGYTRRFV